LTLLAHFQRGEASFHLRQGGPDFGGVPSIRERIEVNGKPAIIAALALLATSCDYLIDASKVRAQFSAEHYCPLERVTVHERPVPAAPIATRPVPPEIAADSARLKMWQDGERARQARLDKEQRDDFRVYEVEGCAIHQTLSCSRYRQHGRWPCGIAP
jgi:hypothetical protein